jgi:GT2 family glycosyltransferase
MKLNSILVIVVTYNGSIYIEKCIASLISNTFPVDILVIDNASTDNTVEIINKKYAFLNVFCNKKNLGFALANNMGIRHAIENNYEYVFLLNQDTLVDKFAIQHLVANFQYDSDLAILSPIHLNYDGTKFENKFSEYIQEPYCNSFLSNLYFNRPK